MADLTNNMLTETGGTMSAVANILFKIFEAVSESRKNRLERQKLKSEQQAMKDRHEDHEINLRKNELNSISGAVPNSVMLEMRAVGISTSFASFQDMSPDNYAKFREYCEMNGVAFSGIENGNGGYTILCRTSDMPFVRDFTENILTELELATVEQSKQEVISNNNLTEEQKQAALQELDKQGDNIQREAYAKFNDKQTIAGTNDVISGKDTVVGAIGFEKALNRNVSYLDGMNDKPYYIADATNPDKFIECTETKYTDVNGTEKIGTQYAVYDLAKQDTPIVTADDFNRNGIDSKEWATGKWAQTKADIKDTGNFSDCVYKVDCKERLDAMRENFNQAKSQIASDISTLDKLVEKLPITPETASKLKELIAQDKIPENHRNFINTAHAEITTRAVKPLELANEAPINQQKPMTRGIDKVRPTTKALEKQIADMKKATAPSSDALAKALAKAVNKGMER